MKIIPLHSAEPTFMKLNRSEWGVSLFFALLIPLFVQSILALFAVVTAAPLYIGLAVVFVIDAGLVHAKSKEQDFLVTWYSNRAIPDALVGRHTMPFHPFIPTQTQEERTHENPFRHRG